MYDGVEMLVELIFFDYFIGHGHSQRLHGVCEGVVIGSDHLVEVVHYVFLEVHHHD